MQVKQEINYMMDVVKQNIVLCFQSMSGSMQHGKQIEENEKVINFTNSALTKYLIKLSANVKESGETAIGSYFHVLNDLERIGDHAKNFHEIGVEMKQKGLVFSELAQSDLEQMRLSVFDMFDLAEKAFKQLDTSILPQLTTLENIVDEQKRSLTATHFARLSQSNCDIELSPYYSSMVAGLERVADHLVNVGYSIVNPIGSQSESKM